MTKMAPVHGKAAVDKALGYKGKSYPVGMCQKFTNELFETGAVGDYDGSNGADAVDGWKKAVQRGKVVHAKNIKSLNDIPASVMLFWTGGSHGHGHAAVGIGKGKMISTDLPNEGRIGEVDISLPHTEWGLTFAGYATVEGNGYDLGSYLPTTKKGVLYSVNTKAGLYARKTADGANVMVDGKKLVRPYGFTVRVLEVKTVNGTKWAKSVGYWYALRYLKVK